MTKQNQIADAGSRWMPMTKLNGEIFRTTVFRWLRSVEIYTASTQFINIILDFHRIRIWWWTIEQFGQTRLFCAQYPKINWFRFPSNIIHRWTVPEFITFSTLVRVERIYCLRLKWCVFLWLRYFMSAALAFLVTTELMSSICVPLHTKFVFFGRTGPLPIDIDAAKKERANMGRVHRDRQAT